MRGLSEAEALFDALPEAAREELEALLTEIAEAAFAEQQVSVPEETGALRRGLTYEVQLQMLRARIGLLNTKSGRSKLFYGRPVNSGIRAQTVTVQRRRRVGGLLRTQSRGSRKRVADIVATYSLHVKARPGVHFIEQGDQAAPVEALLATFWANVETRLGGLHDRAG